MYCPYDNTSFFIFSIAINDTVKIYSHNPHRYVIRADVIKISLFLL